MKRMNYWMPDWQFQGIKHLADEGELTLADVLRRAVEEYLQRHGRDIPRSDPPRSKPAQSAARVG